MNGSQPIRAALAAADEPILLASGAQASRAAREWRRCAVLGMDTEFVRERTYFANLGLVQISDARRVWLLDPLVEDTLPVLRDLLENSSIEKIFHSSSEDLEVLWHTVDAVPEPLLDTQLACALLGHPLQLGYHMTAERLLGVTVEKDLTRSDWCARPLRPDLLRYAALDVCLLPLIWENLEPKLTAKDRRDWLREDCARLVKNARSAPSPEDAWKRIRGAGRLGGRSLAILKALAAWREKEARKKNRPRGFIVKDAVLMTIARHKLREPEELARVDDLHPAARQRYAGVITDIVARTLDSGKELKPIPRPTRAQKQALSKMRALVEDKASELGVEPALLASRRELESLVFSHRGRGLPENLSGWREELLGEELLALRP